MTISYIIPACNAENTLLKAIKSIYGQKIEADDKIEIVVIENGSTDGTLEACQKAAIALPNIVMTSIKTVGTSAARNVGLKMAQGDIIAFCDADDYVEPDCVKHILNCFKESPEIGMVVCGKFNVKKNGEKKLTIPVKKTEYWETRELEARLLYDPSIMGVVWNKFFRKSLIKDKRFDEELTHCEDLDFIFSVLNEYNGKVRIEAFSCYNYVYNPESAVHRPEKLFDEDGVLQYSKSYKELFGTVHGDNKLGELLKYTLVSNCIQNYFVAWKDSQRRLIMADIKQYFFSWFFRMYLRPKEEMIHLGAIALIGLCEVGLIDANKIRDGLFKVKHKRLN